MIRSNLLFKWDLEPSNPGGVRRIAMKWEGYMYIAWDWLMDGLMTEGGLIFYRYEN